ncbi:hypothetical protein [Flavihumibacter fluvii]|uniref:hypothetical protein n=1 Tax=Flavihumibacter fluvii TaxID=2838157 RepID=UPI001BDF4650|nr:hypothetical protein [Flavihumibacter fluvii]ULQ52797.1 hypothetical protein KJS93_00490 [Flavihumibacter fluvii]
MKQMSASRRLLLTAVLSLSSWTMQVSMAMTNVYPVNQDSIIIQKLNNNTKHTINIYTNASQQVLFFSASGEEGRIYQLLLFRQQGKLIKSSKIRNRETTVVSKPDKGNYFFEVYSDDVRIESGTIVVQ